MHWKHFVGAIACLSLLASSAFAAETEDVTAEVDRRVRAWRPTEAERRIDDIAWAADIRTALRLGREAGRPIFLFTLDGRMGVGRQ